MTQLPPVPPESDRPWFRSSPLVIDLLDLLLDDVVAHGWRYSLDTGGLTVYHPVTRQPTVIASEEILGDPELVGAQLRRLLHLADGDRTVAGDPAEGVRPRQSDGVGQWPGPWISPFSGQGIWERSG